jgi:hypothetical protein
LEKVQKTDKGLSNKHENCLHKRMEKLALSVDYLNVLKLQL